MSHSAPPTLRVRTARPADAPTLRRLARRLGEDPDAGAPGGAVTAARRERDLSDALRDDPERRIQAALEKSEGLVAARRLGRLLLERARDLASEADADALEADLAQLEREAGEGGVHAAAGRREGLAPYAADCVALLERFHGERRRARLLAALRELIADEIAERRQRGAGAEEAAALLNERVDLLACLPLRAHDLAAIGLDVAVEAAVDGALARALIDASAALAAMEPQADALAPGALKAAAAIATEELGAALRSGDPARVEAALAPRDLASGLPAAFAVKPLWIDSEALLAQLSEAAEAATE